MLLMAVIIVDFAVPMVLTMPPPPLPWVPLLENFITPKRTPLVLLMMFPTTRLAMTILAS